MKFLAQLAIVLALGAAATPALAQGDRVLPNDAPKARAKAAKAKQKGAVGDAIIERLLSMNEQQRAQALDRLAPARRNAALRILRQLELLSPEERQVLRGRYQLFLGMPVARQRAIRQELRELRSLPRAERRARLASEDLRSRFSEDEVQLLYEVMGLPEP